MLHLEGVILDEAPALLHVVAHEHLEDLVGGHVVTGLHLQHFEHWLLRWLYVLGGLLGCACIATGFIFFVEKRRQQHARAGSQGSRIVDAFAVATVTGMVIAALAMLAVNRLLPADMTGKGDVEKWVFWGSWLLTFVHAAVRSAPVARALHNPAWREQSFVIALLAVLLIVLCRLIAVVLMSLPLGISVLLAPGFVAPGSL